MLQDQKTYKAALSTYPTGVCVVTAQSGPAARGITVNSFASLSMQPRLVSWCIDVSARAYAVFSAASHYNVHILSSTDRALAERFADGDNQDIPCDPNAVAPQLHAGVARLVCVVRDRIIIGDHLMLVGEVEHHDLQPGAALTYYRGRFGQME